MKKYGYHRTSTREQHLDRGIKEITIYCEQNNLELEKIFTDQQTGKNFNRPRYQVLKEDVLRAVLSQSFQDILLLSLTIYLDLKQRRILMLLQLQLYCRELRMRRLRRC